MGGGDMMSWFSPYDPIFFAHHAMIDYIWWQWLHLGEHNLVYNPCTDLEVARNLPEELCSAHNMTIRGRITDPRDVVDSMNMIDDVGRTPMVERACVRYEERSFREILGDREAEGRRLNETVAEAYRRRLNFMVGKCWTTELKRCLVRLRAAKMLRYIKAVDAPGCPWLKSDEETEDDRVWHRLLRRGRCGAKIDMDELRLREAFARRESLRFFRNREFVPAETECDRKVC